MEKTEQFVTVKKCAEMTGLEYRWLLQRVKGLNPPPLYLLEGQKKPKVIAREVMEWAKEQGKTGASA